MTQSRKQKRHSPCSGAEGAFKQGLSRMKQQQQQAAAAAAVKAAVNVKALAVS
jgi:hypothetical protein